MENDTPRNQDVPWGQYLYQNITGYRRLSNLGSNSQEKFYQKQCRNNVGQNGNLFCLATENLHDSVADQANADGVSDRTGNRHTNEHQGYRNDLIHIVEVDFLQSLKHQNAHVDQCGGGGSCRDNSGNRRIYS